MGSKATIILFCRSELVHIYALYYLELKSIYNIILVAYSDVELDILKNKYKIDEEIIIFKKVYKTHLDTLNDIALEQYDELDQTILKCTDRTFNLNTAINADRTFRHKAYNEALRMTYAYYLSWQEIFASNVSVVNYFIHEPVSLMMNFVAYIVATRNGGKYISQIMVAGLSKYNYLFIEGLGHAIEINELARKDLHNNDANKSLDYTREREYLKKFRSDYNTFFQSGVKKVTPIKLIKPIIKKWLYNKIKQPRFNIEDNIESYLNDYNLNLIRYKNLVAYKKALNYDTPEEGDKYYYFPLHLEPEAVVLYWAENMYTGQVKLIENIANQLPPKHYLYVKDHPHLLGYRAMEDYEKIQALPNVKLIAPSYSGKLLIKDCIGVITINGTSGLEALLNNKHVYTFGNALYNACERVKKIPNIRNLREVLYHDRDKKLEDDLELLHFTKAYLDAQHEGFVSYFGDYATRLGIDHNSNAQLVSKGIVNFISRNENR